MNKELNPYSPSEMLSMYMDGELEASLIPSFEEELSKNSELQSEYRELLAIREAVQKDVKKLVPPYETTATLFESLGISYTSSIASSPSVGMSIWQQIMMPLVASFSAVLVTIGTTMGVDLFDNTDSDNNTLRISVESSIQKDIDNSANITESEVDKLSNNEIQSNEIGSNSTKVIKPNESKFVKSNLTNEAKTKANSGNKIIKENVKSDVSQFDISNENRVKENIEIFKIFLSDLNINQFDFISNGLESKFGYNYNNQRLERLPSTLQSFNIGFGSNAINSGRILFEVNLDKYRFFSDYGFNTIGLNFSTNTFAESFLWNPLWNPNLALELKREFNTLFSGLSPQIFAGGGHDFNSQSQFFRGGLGVGVSLPSNYVLEFRGEYNSIINIDNIQLQDLNYINNNRWQFIVNFKLKF
jgi:hypothetical protein